MSLDKFPVTEEEMEMSNIREIYHYTALSTSKPFSLNGEPSAKLVVFFDHNNYDMVFGVMAKEIDEEKPVRVRVEFWVGRYMYYDREEEDMEDESDDGKIGEGQAVDEFVFKYEDQQCKFWPTYEERAFIQNESCNEGCIVLYCRLTFLGYHQECKPQLGQLLWKLYQEGSKFETATIQVDDKEYQVSPAVLSAHSDAFHRMLTSPNFQEARSKVIKLEGISDKVMHALIKWLYTEEKPSEDVAEDLFVVADKYLVAELKSHCSKLMYATLTEQNKHERLALSRMHNDRELEEKITDYIRAGL